MAKLSAIQKHINKVNGISRQQHGGKGRKNRKRDAYNFFRRKSTGGSGG